jgi:hypothetical protein
MRLHERTMKVQAATAQLRMDMIRFQDEHGLTNLEMVQALQQIQATKLKYMLRAERHPDDPDRGADEA